jgi:hypothetical protein
MFILLLKLTKKFRAGAAVKKRTIKTKSKRLKEEEDDRINC